MFGSYKKRITEQSYAIRGKERDSPSCVLHYVTKSRATYFPRFSEALQRKSRFLRTALLSHCFTVVAGLTADTKSKRNVELCDCKTGLAAGKCSSYKR